MSALLQSYFDQFLVFVLVLTRLSGTVMTAPIFGSRSTPLQVRAMLAVALALIVTPLQAGVAANMPRHLLGLLFILSRELLLGLALGLAVMILFTALQLAGQIVGQISGMSLADVFDPTFDTSVPVFTQLLHVIALSVFVISGGHRYVLRALLDSFQWRPPGTDNFPVELVETVSGVMADSFLVAIRAAAPAMVALLLSVLILGLISRTLPQLNILAVGFSVNAMVLLLALSLSLSSIVWVIQEQTEVTLEAIDATLSESER